MPVPTIPMRPIAQETRGVSRIDFVSGRTLSGRYVMVEKLGEGGMGTVYLAEDLLLRRRVALKTLWTDDAYDPGDIERFRKEVSLAHAVNHANVARTYDLGEADGVQYIAMEHLKGQTLMARIKKGPPLTSQEVRDLAVPLCRGLRAAHEVGVVHRDLKPANVMLVEDERRVVIMDFGIGRSIGDADEPKATEGAARDRPTGAWDVTSAGLGTPAYMAPEQWDEQSGDQRTDIYALGVILYVALTNQAPYSADTAAALAEQHRSAPIPDVGAIAKGVPKDLALLIRDCLAKKPADRPQTMEEVLERLERPSLRRKYLGDLLIAALGTAIAAFVLASAIYTVAERALLREMRPALVRLAQLLAHDIDVNDLDQVHTPQDVKGPAFARVHDAMARWYSPDISDLYTMQKTAKPGHFTVAVDWRPGDFDTDGDGEISLSEKGFPPGSPYDGTMFPAMVQTSVSGKPQADENFAQDQFAVSLSAYAPVLRQGKASEYFVGVDMPNVQLSELKLRLVIVLCGAWLGGLAVLAFVLDPQRRRRHALKTMVKAKERAVL